MKKTVKNILLLLLFGATQVGLLHAQTQHAPLATRELASTLLKQKITYHVRVPDGYHTSKKRYTVLYLLHGDAQWVEETATLAQTTHEAEATPEIIVVGIETEGRDLDRLTYTPKAQQYLAFMAQELMPAIEKKYRTDKRRILLDKSLRGSFALYAFLTKPTLFNGYIAASKQWYDANNDYFTGLANKALQNPHLYKGRKIFLATMNGAYNNNDVAEVDRQMQAFAEMLRTKSGKKISSKHQTYDDWAGVPNSSVQDGLAFVCAPHPPALTMKQQPNGKWAILDNRKQVLYEVFTYDNGPDAPEDGLIRIVKNSKIGYADANTYAVVIPPQFDCAYPFENGKAKVSKNCKSVKDGQYYIWESDAWQYVDKKGNF